MLEYVMMPGTVFVLPSTMTDCGRWNLDDAVDRAEERQVFKGDESGLRQLDVEAHQYLLLCCCRTTVQY